MGVEPSYQVLYILEAACRRFIRIFTSISNFFFGYIVNL
jgi:hypothetical protein